MNNNLPPAGPGNNEQEPGNGGLSDVWYSATQVGEIYHVSKSLLFIWRTEMGLAFSKIGKKIRYNKTDIDQFWLRFRDSGFGPGKLGRMLICCFSLL